MGGATWIAWRDADARDAFMALAGGRAYPALLMRQDFEAMQWGAETGFWAPLEVFATEGWESGRISFEKLKPGGVGKMCGDNYVCSLVNLRRDFAYGLCSFCCSSKMRGHHAINSANVESRLKYGEKFVLSGYSCAPA